MQQGNHISAEEEAAFNAAIAKRIAEHWLGRGWRVCVWAAPVDQQPKQEDGDRMRGCRVYEVRSDMVNGLPADMVAGPR